MEGKPYLAMTSFPLNRSALTSKEDALEEAEVVETAPRDAADRDRRRVDEGEAGSGSSMKDSGGAMPSVAGLKETNFLMPLLAEAMGGTGTPSGGV